MLADPAASTRPHLVLQPHEGLPAGVRYLPSTPATVRWGRLPGVGDPAVLTIGPGESLVVDTVSHEGLMPDQGSDPVRYFGSHGVAAADVLADAVEVAARVHRDPGADGPHVVTGPIAVQGAQPGDLLAVRVDRLAMRAPYGVVSTRHARGVLAGHAVLDGHYGAFCAVPPGQSAHATMPLRREGPGLASIPLAPFLGLVGVVPDAPGRAHSVPPGPHGGNLDIRLLTEGSTLYLPVQVPGAMLYLGDPHFAQGDGEVALTALEAPLRATLTVDLLPAAQVRAGLPSSLGPFAAAHGHLVPTGLSEDLDEALRLCTQNAVELVHRVFGMDRDLAYLHLSAATDFRISQAVDLVKGVHGAIDVSLFDTAVEGALVRHLLGRAR